MHNTQSITQAIAALPKSFWQWVERTFTPAYQSEVERYLAQSTDHSDLTRRVKYLQYRGMI